jgi:hypothetical protein
VNHNMLVLLNKFRIGLSHRAAFHLQRGDPEHVTLSQLRMELSIVGDQGQDCEIL